MLPLLNVITQTTDAYILIYKQIQYTLLRMFGISLYQEKHLPSGRQPSNLRSLFAYASQSTPPNPYLPLRPYTSNNRLSLSDPNTGGGFMVSWRPGLQSRFLFVLQEGGPGPGLAQRETTPVLSPYTSTVDYSPNALSNFNIPPHYQ